MTMDKEVLFKSSNSTPSLDFTRNFTQCLWCIPSRTTLFIVGYINLIYNISFALFCIPVSIYIVAAIVYDGIIARMYEEYSSKLDVDFLPMQTFNNPVYTIALYTAVKSSVIALTAACMVGLHLKKPGPIILINCLSVIRIIYAFYAVTHHHLFYEFQMYSIVLKAFEIGFAAYFAVLYYYYALQLKQEALDRQAILSIEQVYIQFPATIEKEKLCENNSFVFPDIYCTHLIKK